MLYKSIFSALNRSKVKYAVAGGVATVLHGFARFTADLDIVVELSPANIKKLFSALNRLGYLSRVPVTADQFMDPKARNSWRKDKNMKAFSFAHKQNPLFIVDVLLEESRSFAKMKPVFFKFEETRIPTVSLKDLTRMKRRAARPKDLEDIKVLNRVNRARKRMP